MNGPAGTMILSVAAAVKAVPESRVESSSDLVAYGLFFLSAVLLVGILVYWATILIRKRRRLNANPVNGSSVCPEDMAANTELVVALLRKAAPGTLLAYLDNESTQFDGDLQRFLTILKSPYETELRAAAADGNTYLALARSQRATVALIEDVERLCERVEDLNHRTITKDHVSVVAAKTMIGGLVLLCTIGGLVIGAVQVL